MERHGICIIMCIMCPVMCMLTEGSRRLCSEDYFISSVHYFVKLLDSKSTEQQVNLNSKGAVHASLMCIGLVFHYASYLHTIHVHISSSHIQLH